MGVCVAVSVRGGRWACCRSATVVLIGVCVAVSVRAGRWACCWSATVGLMGVCVAVSVRAGWWACCWSATVVLMGVCVAVSVRGGRWACCRSATVVTSCWRIACWCGSWSTGGRSRSSRWPSPTSSWTSLNTRPVRPSWPLSGRDGWHSTHQRWRCVI